MDVEQRRAIEWDAIQHVLRFYRALDRSDYAAAVECFDDTGTWDRMGALHHGRAAITDALAGRDEHLQIRHVVSNLVADVADDDRVTVTSYVVVFLDRTGGDGPGKLDVPKSIWSNTTNLVFAGDGWRITAHGGDVVMTRPG